MNGEFKSPLPKKIKQKEDAKKDSSFNYTNVEQILEHNAKLEKEIENVIEERHLSQKNSIQSYLENVKMALPKVNSSDFNQPVTDYLESAIKKFKHSSKSHKHNKIKQKWNHLEVLTVLEEKKRCKISQVIDNIKFA